LNLKNLDRVNELRDELKDAREVLAAFEAIPVGDHIKTFAHAMVGMHRRFTIELMPVPRITAIEAARVDVRRVVKELAALGVLVPLEAGEDCLSPKAKEYEDADHA
jgi:hypothetical protein